MITNTHSLARLVAFGLWTMSIAGAAQQRGPVPEQRGAIRGSVVRAGLGTPIRGATLTIVRIADENGIGNDVIAANNPGGVTVRNGRGSPTPGALRGAGQAEIHSVQTDSSGVYVLGGLEPGQYRVRASASGFVSQGHGQQSLDMLGTPVSLTANGVRTVDFHLLSSSAIEGLVTNQDGLPMADSKVQVYAASYETGQLTLIAYSTAQANGDGEYRIPYIDPGEYYVAASPSAAQSILPSDTAVPQRATVGRGGPPGVRGAGPLAVASSSTDHATVTKAYPPTFYPSSSGVRDAAVIPIVSGLDAHAIHITLRPVILSSIRGRVIVPAVSEIQGQRAGPAAAGASPPARGARGPGAFAGAGGAGAAGAATPGRGDPAPRGAGFRGGAMVGPAAGSLAAGLAAGINVELIPVGISAAGSGAGRGGIAAANVGRGRGSASRTAVGGTEIVRVAAGPDGTFRIDNVIPGSYILFASTPVAGRLLTASGQLDVSFTGIDNYTLALRQAQSVSGQIYLDGPATQNDRADSAEITLTPADNLPIGSVSGRAGADGRFKLDNVAPGRYRMTVRAQGAAYAEKALFDGVDALNEAIQVDGGDTPIQILMGFTEGRVEAVVEQAGKPIPNARALLAPATRSRLDLFMQASSDRNGRVVFSNVPPGTYKLFAWASMSRATAWRNPAFLEPFESSGRIVTVAKAGSVSEIRVTALPHTP